MIEKSLEEQLTAFQEGTLSKDEFINIIKGISSLPFAQLDLDRKNRTGQAECIFGEGKTAAQIVGLSRILMKHQSPLLATRVSLEKAQIIQKELPDIQYDPQGRVLWWSPITEAKSTNEVGVVCAGTSDIPVLIECCTTLELYGHKPKRYVDIGVAGLHRLLNALPEIRKHRVLIVIAGMEGALPSVLAGLVTAPVIAVPTRIGYGANQNGITTLLAMLSSCASGIATVNIENGYGAACFAARIMDQQ